jgi:hypothetical protein
MREFDSALIGFAALDEDALSRPWTWRDGRMDVRYALYRTLEEAQEALVRVAAGTHPESRRILAMAQRALGDLRYAIDRTDAEPVRIPDDRLPTAAQLDASGEIDALLGRLGDARAESNRWLGDVAPAAMARPTVWVHYTIDVRFRFHRFTAHLLEHTIQCEKILDALGHRQTEGRRIVRQICAAIGELEGLGALAEARDVETRLVERFASVVA